jgi:NAD(P) transhydrogenase subunit alpha
VVITTAAIPGKPAPVLLTAGMVNQLKPGSVIVDLGAETGGNCELTEPGLIVVKEDVTLIGLTNLPALMPMHASQMFSKNLENLVLHLAGKDGAKDGLKLDLADPITAGITVTHGGALVHPQFKAA